MEEAFANEITAMYYMNLCKDVNSSIDHSFKLLNRSPIECLSTILEQDRGGHLMDWFNKCMKDLEAFQEDTLKITRARMQQLAVK
jgi:CHASE3 domain sensor protein